MDDWRPVGEAVSDGTVCNLRFRDSLGWYDSFGEYFLHDDGKWYLIDPPREVAARVTHWKPVGTPNAD